MFRQTPAAKKPSYQWTDHGPGHDTGISIIHLIYDRMIQGNTSTNCMGLLLWVCWDFTFDPVNRWIHCKYSRVYPDLSSHLQALYSSGMQRKNVRGKHIGVYIGHSRLVDTNVILRSELQQSFRKESLTHLLGFNRIFWHSFPNWKSRYLWKMQEIPEFTARLDGQTYPTENKAAKKLVSLISVMWAMNKTWLFRPSRGLYYRVMWGLQYTKPF